MSRLLHNSYFLHSTSRGFEKSCSKKFSGLYFGVNLEKNLIRTEVDGRPKTSERRITNLMQLRSFYTDCITTLHHH
ncbi:hypothetical protein L1887_10082 [Cichorium endivia]|nr:hypothetical protein L1887_10082 [Cichorium endivia]